MSITSALSSALSGLTAQSRAADVVAANLANLTTESFGRREIELTSAAQGFAGVRVAGVTRQVDSGVLADRRIADSDLAAAQTRADFVGQVQRAVGTPDDPASLPARITALEASLVNAAARPEDETRLGAVMQRAQDVVSGFGAASDEIQTRRMAAEAEIETVVDRINVTLEQVHGLNSRIVTANTRGQDTAGLADQRQAAIDRIAGLVPLREVPRGNGAVALMTPAGAVLLDGSPARLDFTRANTIVPQMTLAGGGLSGLAVNGQAIPPAGESSPIAGGRLSALFELRDDHAVRAQADLDALARDIVERLQRPGLDPTLAAGDAGLLTDAGTRFATTDEIGLSGRMALNAAVDPQAGGALWRLRDGLGATAQGPVGDARLLNGMTDALGAARAPASGPFAGPSRSAAGHAAALTSRIGQDAQTAERDVTFAATRRSELQETMLADGVDSDAETARLLVIEQAYGANARMIRTLDEMMQTLLRI